MIQIATLEKPNDIYLMKQFFTHDCKSCENVVKIGKWSQKIVHGRIKQTTLLPNFILLELDDLQNI